ncbi:MAG: bifunctional adenosylcobinamide kinase/adenosylcobinamide-phosphate guanylyltransferase [Syntrophorhabdus sp.]|jgi:adenosylcobinamide kinase/adenosylcobinamide-phosphate guanylyltransferase|nr:bifunctional adenosylcobinamide kinase/adenosylcobinamide-phosphate guanylyltransferase [Syntrophorhabdus sp.]
MPRTVLILGGARSGKSSFALREASLIAGQKAFVATAEALDDEMETRINNHRSERGPEWKTFEEPLEVPSLIRKIGPSHGVVLIDCLTLWVSNIMMRGLSVEQYEEDLVDALSDPGCAPLIYIVSNEVGLGLVPESPMGREYRDNLGRLNARVASVVTDVYFLAAGIPMKIKETR